MVWIMAWTANAAPSAQLCEAWGEDLTQQAQALASVKHSLTSTTLNIESAVVRFSQISARVEGGICRIRASGNIDLSGQAQVALYGMSTACRVGLAAAPVAARLDIAGNAAEPRVVSSTSDIDGLRQNMTLCVNVDVVKGFVVDLADDYIQRNKGAWHKGIEQALAR